ncbi:hypothetical protein BDV33DRAFT_198716 [Aspergillus novoparasiticus]|uniref:Uncharacterized protein n=1 Tax=Aspergillus novoparasiticus TaxID=986946 RepID=A0A5N6F6R7_9EURO|nr:hypothetical protein BDV33DRAFT_198716 [Aspergillus novoparasiticus]
MKSLSIFLFCLLVLIATTAADEIAKGKKLVGCVNKEIEKENAEWKLQNSELRKLKNIIDEEIMKEPLGKHVAEEQRKVLKDIDDAAEKEFPKVPTDTREAMMVKLKEHSMHCCKEMGS